MSAASLARQDALWLALPVLGGSPACAETDPDAFFPTPEDMRIGAAKRVCAGCGVREACLEWALRRREKHGIWGGKTVNEREALLRQRDAETSPEVAA